MLNLVKHLVKIFRQVNTSNNNIRLFNICLIDFSQFICSLWLTTKDFVRNYSLRDSGLNAVKLCFKTPL